MWICAVVASAFMDLAGSTHQFDCTTHYLQSRKNHQEIKYLSWFSLLELIVMEIIRNPQAESTLENDASESIASDAVLEGRKPEVRRHRERSVGAMLEKDASGPAASDTGL